ncbi:hypothetical protein K2173_023896 [Erythroxylum novogranatense]|uniref:Late embryogenesis abundant protein n=1 Tax=Erythroxylum novogranatense TaxID=1862640 RepID=A0AAV8TR39_9ROSI|nr:hypothetical protein K2173_023896 [Erythroxylum novogranatense]
MTRAGIAPTRIFMLRVNKQVKHHFHSPTPAGSVQEQLTGMSKQSSPGDDSSSSSWIPHPRNGIYVPKGHEGMMDDIPESAVSCNNNQAFWLRSVDGVDKPDPDLPSDHPLHTSTNLY